MIRGATAINSFASQAAQDDFVPPSEESVFILTSGQLQNLIKEAIQPLQDHIEALEVIIARQNEKIAELESSEEQDISRLALDIAYDRQRLAKLERIEPQPLQKDRGEILRALIAANGGKMLAKDARQKMHLSESRFSELLATTNDHIEIKPYYLRKNQNVLILK
jgi:uncharacterized membrane protein